ncbi:GNAT family N-acetyltransferase [Lactococcus insecticola]|uniref:GNAT family acetyltransferase n=1 Tax=Pseudolactococcus insecticola TaxID=2709158 RepID=A0A6A0B7U4_9LACT|nr:GNAT family N-acetyltransferase [Lactococcus insecticola]GFH40538.1 GNAT family acetyltransferase [Lactococcus insecticola]
MEIKQTRDTMSDVYFNALKIRNAVFVKEQGVPLSLEIDKDEAYAVHFVLYFDDATPVSTLRILPDDANKSALIQRVATLDGYRGQNYATQLLVFVLEFLESHGFETAFLHAQTQVVEFYKQFGFETYGEPFEDAGMTHLAMKKTV